MWRKGCEGGNHRNDKVLAQANAALFSHIGNQIGAMVDSNKLKTLVRWGGRSYAGGGGREISGREISWYIQSNNILYIEVLVRMYYNGI